MERFRACLEVAFREEGNAKWEIGRARRHCAFQKYIVFCSTVLKLDPVNVGPPFEPIEVVPYFKQPRIVF